MNEYNNLSCSNLYATVVSSFFNYKPPPRTKAKAAIAGVMNKRPREDEPSSSLASAQKRQFGAGIYSPPSSLDPI